MADWRGGVSGAASGAALGSQLGTIVPGIGNLVGTGVGAVVGGIGGLFGGGGRRREERARQRQIQQAQEQVRGRNAALLAMLQGFYDDLQTQAPGTTQFFRTGAAELDQAIEDQAERDAASAVARGLSGGELELAQAAARNRALVSGRRNLLADSEHSLEGQRQAALSRLLSGTALANQGDLASIGQANIEGGRQDRRDAAWQQMVSDLFATGMSVFGPEKKDTQVIKD